MSVHPATKGDIRVLRLVVFFDLVISFCFFFHHISTKRNQPLNIQCRSSWNSCQAWLQLPFFKACNNRVQRLFWWWQVHWQYPSAWAVHVTAWKTAGCFLCLFGASVACCAQCVMMALCCIAFWIVEVYFQYDFFLMIYSGLGFTLQSARRIALSCRDSRMRADFLNKVWFLINLSVSLLFPHIFWLRRYCAGVPLELALWKQMASAFLLQSHINICG